MFRNKLRKVLSLNGISIIFGILGGILGFFTAFVPNWQMDINSKWLVLFSFLAITIILILSAIISELLKELRVKIPHKAKAVRYINSDDYLLIELNDFLGTSAMVTIFYLDDDYEVILGTGYVLNIQEKFVTIKILHINTDFMNRYAEELERIQINDIRAIQKILVKSYVTYPNLVL